ncbi:MAG TPA: hypothetical protein VF980_00965 [Thermoanaerobaculia bacterium]
MSGVAAAVVLVLAIGAGGTAMLTRAHRVRHRARAVQASVMTTSGRLVINAYPWANVTSIRNVSTGIAVEIDTSFVTPSAVDLAPGRYQVMLANAEYGEPVQRVIDVAPGKEASINVQFEDGARAPLPDLEGESR